MYYTKQQWYTPSEVAVHITTDDCWVSANGKVYDLTIWLKDQFRKCGGKSKDCKYKCPQPCPKTHRPKCRCNKQGYSICESKRAAMTILAYAGKDLSHWFKGEEHLCSIHPITGASITHQFHGNDATQPVVPSTRWRPLENPWWLNEAYIVGRCTARTRPLRITNTLISSTITLEVCSEETLYEIMMRYFHHNRHLSSYTWRYLNRALRMDKTLAQNGIPDERDIFNDVGLPENCHVPNIMLYFNDDLTEEKPALPDIRRT